MLIKSYNKQMFDFYFRRLEEFAVMHIALTGVGCKRITRKNGLLLPYIEGKDAVVQILTDLRQFFLYFFNPSLMFTL